MNRIERLLAELAPDGVPHLPLGSVGTFASGGGPQKRDLLDSGIPAIHYGQIYTHYGVSSTSTLSFVAEALARRSKQAEPGDVIIADTSENDEDLGRAVAWLGTVPAAVSNHTLIFSSQLVDPVFLSYFLRSQGFQDQKSKLVYGTKVRSISRSNMAKVIVPVPPLEVQREVVGILDKFTELEGELEGELEARLSQRRYFQSRFVRASGDYPIESLGALADIGTGNRNTNEACPDGPFPFFVRSQEPLRIASYGFDETAIITAGDGVGVGKVFHFVKGKYALHQRAYRISVRSSRIDAKYLFHFLRADFPTYLERTSVHASVTSLRKPMFERYQVPLPPLEVQQRSAEFLDRLDALINDISVGLPAELNARRKQYEYYRDKLLTFEEAR